MRIIIIAFSHKIYFTNLISKYHDGLNESNFNLIKNNKKSSFFSCYSPPSVNQSENPNKKIKNIIY